MKQRSTAAELITALLVVFLVPPTIVFYTIHIVRGPGDFILPFLIGANLLAGLIAASLLAIAQHRLHSQRRGLVPLTFIAVAICFLIAGPLICLAENLAVSVSETSGWDPGDVGHRDFYPGDSGMSHWPTRWHVSLSVGALTSPAWMLSIPLLLGLAEQFSRSLTWIGPRNPRVVASILMVPAGLVLMISSGLIPWLLETRARLDNAHWEWQLTMATIALGTICLSLPGLAVRTIGKPRWGSGIIWGIAVTSYALVGAFILQSHFPLISKFVVGLFCLLFSGMACVGFASERPTASGAQVRELLSNT